MWDSRNFKKYGAFGESAYSITLHHSGESGNSDESSDTGDLGNTGGSEKSDDSDYFCTMGDSGISEESGAFSDYTQSHRSGDFGSSGVGCEEYRFSIRTNIQTKKQYEQMSEYICIKEMIRTNIRIYSYQENVTFKYSNIFI